MISSGSESVDEPAGCAEEHGAVKAESSDEREVAADWRNLKKAKDELGQDSGSHGCQSGCTLKLVQHMTSCQNTCPEPWVQ